MDPGNPYMRVFPSKLVEITVECLVPSLSGVYIEVRVSLPL